MGAGELLFGHEGVGAPPGALTAPSSTHSSQYNPSNRPHLGSERFQDRIGI